MDFILYFTHRVCLSLYYDWYTLFFLRQFFTTRSEILKVQSSVTGKCYETNECVYIVNPLQVYKYLINDAVPLDILAGEDNKIVYVYNRKLTHDLYDRWCKREL